MSRKNYIRKLNIAAGIFGGLFIIMKAVAEKRKEGKDINDERIDEIIDEAFINEDLSDKEFKDLINGFKKVFNEKFSLNIPEHDEIEKMSAYEIIISHKYSYYEQSEQEEDENDL